MPRVISGQVGGLRLQAPAGERTRPTTDRAKEAIFSVLTSRLDFSAAEVLDLFAGSGQLGIECLSRGARRAVFVEKSRPVCALIRSNLEHCGLAAGAELHVGDALAVLRDLVAEGRRFRCIFADPPYALVPQLRGELLERAAELLEEGGIFVLESDASGLDPGRGRPVKAGKKGRSRPVPGPETGGSGHEDVNKLQEIKRCHYGVSVLSFYTHK